MAKKVSMKQQIYQQIANKQVEQVLNQQREQQNAQLMADFDNFMKQQQNPEALMADFNSWKQQNAAPQPRQTIPSIADTQPKRDLQAEAREYFANVRKERAAEEAEAKRLKEQQLKATINDYARQQQEENMLASNSASKKKELKVGQRPEATDTSSQVAARPTHEKIDTTNVPVDVDRWLSPDTKLTDAERLKAKEYASAELQKIQYGPNKTPLFENEEQRQHYADMVNLINKTNGLTNTLSGALEIPYNLADMVSDGARSVGNQLKGLGAAITDKVGATEGATKRHNEEVELANQFADQNEANMRQNFKNAQTQNPVGYTAGKIAGQMGMYMLTNPVFDGIAAGAGVESELAKFFINQGAQNVQDLVLDTAPTVRQLMEDGSTPEEVKREALNNILWNVAGNAVMGGLGTWAGNRAARKASDEAFRENVRAGADNLSRIANEIPGIEDADNVVRNATRQAEEAAQNIDDLAKQMPESFNATEIYGDIDNYFARKYPGGKSLEQVMAEREALIKQIDDYEHGRLPQTEYIQLGQTPEYMRAYGNINNPFVMKQSTINKTAYPEGYFNGKHNLGFEALSKIPEQLNDPAAVMDSLSQGDSGVALTNMLKGDRPVIAPIHMDKPSPMGPINELASIHDRDLDNVGHMLENTNKPYINKEKVRDVLSGNGLQLSELKATSDPLLNHKVTDAISDVNKNSVNSVARTTPELSTDTQEKIASDFEEIYRGMEDMRSVVESSGSQKVADKYEKLQQAVFKYEELVYNSESLEEINKAKKAADAARQGFIREVKKIDPNFKGSLTGTKLGNAEFRRTSTAPTDSALLDEIVEDMVKQDMENPNRFVKDAKPDSTNVYRGVNDVPGANPLQTFAGKTNSDINETIRQANKNILNGQLQSNTEMQRLLKDEDFLAQATENARAAGQRMANPEDDLRRLSGERAYYEKRLDANKSAGEKEDEALEALTNYVNSQRQTPPPSGPTRNIPEEVTRNIPQRQTSNNPPSPPRNNPPSGNGDEWRISKARTNTYENQGWGDQLPERDYAYRVQTTADTHEIKAERYRNSENIANELLNKDYDTFDAADVKASMEEIQRLMDEEDFGTAKRLSQRLAREGREGGRTVQAFAEYNKNTTSGALRDANNAQEDLVLEPWRSRNTKAREGNSRIAKALADMGHKPISKAEKAPLTHDQIKKGVIAELNREVGSVEKYFNDNDIEFLTQLAEDKSIPTWKITSEIEHKLNTGNWYTLDESVEIPKPTNTKLQNALNSLVTEQVRAEKPAPTLQQIMEEVRNTLGKESADFEGKFDDNDIEYIANLINNGATKQELADALDMKMATGSFGISDETLQEVNNIFKSISKYDVNSKQFVEGQAEAYRLLADEILPDATPMEKFEAWRYLAMLGNPKTMLRNFIGNKTFSAVTGISNNVAALAEAGIDKGIKALGGEGIQRTKSVLNPISDKPLIKAAKEDADFSRYRQIIGSKYEKMDKDSLRKQKSVFKSKAAQLYEKITDAGISDYRAVKNKYSTSLAGYLKANGYDTNIFKAEDELARLKNLGESRLLSSAEKARIESLTKDVEALEKARDFALKQAEYATFHEDNKMASMLSEWSRSSKERGTGIGHVLIEGMIPFKKTPANVLRSGVEYSPLGAIKSLKETGKLVYENTGKRAGNLADTYINKKGKEVARTFASDVIDSWAKTLTGTGLTALGFYLYNKGALHSSDPDTKYQDELEGHQNYALEINGKSYTIDWAAPTVMPLMVGAEIAKVWNSTGKEDSDFYDHINEYLETANRLADPLVETSMLSGVKDTLDTAANFVRNNEAINIIPLLGYNLATGYATQAVPTIGGQIARTIDPTRRSTYTDKEGFVGVVDKQIKKQMNKIPGLSYRNQEFIDTYGRTQNNSPFNNPIGNLAYQMFSPGYLNNINETGADRISREAYAAGKNENTLPKWQSKFKDAEGKRVSPEDFKTASIAYGKANYEIRDALSNDDWFNSLDASQKEEVVKSVNTIAEHTGNAAIDPEYDKNSKPYHAYKEGGIPGLLDYYKDQQAGAMAKESGLGATSKAYKEIKEDIKNGNTEAAETKITDAQKITDAGINSYGYGAFKANKSRITNTDDWIKQYNAIDSLGTGKAKSDGFVNQDEFLTWVKKNGYSVTEAEKYAKLYGTWKQVPYIKKDGTWGFHNAK